MFTPFASQDEADRAFLSMDIGINGSTNNSSFLGFSNKGGSGSSNNYGMVGIGGYGASIAWFPSNDVSIGSTTDCGSNLCVGSIGAPVGVHAQISTGTGSISTTCSSNSTSTVSATVNSYSTFVFTPTSDISSVSGWSSGSLYFDAWPTTNTINYRVCNASSGSISPGSSVTWNISVQ